MTKQNSDEFRIENSLNFLWEGHQVTCISQVSVLFFSRVLKNLIFFGCQISLRFLLTVSYEKNQFLGPSRRVPISALFSFLFLLLFVFFLAFYFSFFFIVSTIFFIFFIFHFHIFHIFIFHLFSFFFFVLFFAFSFFSFFKVGACNSVFTQALLHNVMGNMGGRDIIIYLQLLAPCAPLTQNPKLEHAPLTINIRRVRLRCNLTGPPWASVGFSGPPKASLAPPLLAPAPPEIELKICFLASISVRFLKHFFIFFWPVSGGAPGSSDSPSHSRPTPVRLLPTSCPTLHRGYCYGTPSKSFFAVADVNRVAEVFLLEQPAGRDISHCRCDEPLH